MWQKEQNWETEREEKKLRKKRERERYETDLQTLLGSAKRIRSP